MEPIHYLDFDLKITKTDAGYRAEVLHSPGGEGRVDFSLPFEPMALENLLLRMTRLRRKVRRVDSPELAAARQLGGGLYQAVFQGTVRDCLRSSLDKAEEHPQTGLRIRLRLQDAPELVNLPWEFLYDPDGGRFLTQSVQTPVVRYLEFSERIKPLKVDLPMHILGMVSSPSGYEALDVEDEKARLSKALRPLIDQGVVQIRWLETATLDELRQALRSGTYHVFHFIGHGGLDLETEQGVLLLTDESGRGVKVGAERLGVLLHDHRSMRLAVLNACEGARATVDDPFASLAANLVRQGIPAVVAMQFEISDKAARVFAQEFYAALAHGYAVDAGLGEARKAIYCLPEDVEWGTPVLYLRAPDGVLFDVAAALVKAPEVAEPIAVKPAQEQPKTPVAKPAAQPQPETRKPASAAARVKRPDPLAEYATFIQIPERNFWIGKYPVTNELYRRFLKAPDFAEYKLWVGFPKIGELPGCHQLGDWGKDGWMWLQMELGKKKVVYPREWGNGEFGIKRKNAPVTSLTWYEANAYCKWLHKHWAGLIEGWQNPNLQPALVRLPTDVEWVFAAGGDQPEGRYPWDALGNATSDMQEIARRANVMESHIGCTTAVGQYPQGASQPYGVFDMAGNIWEWQANCSDDSHRYLSLRGGSWKTSYEYARVRILGRSFPYQWGENGFRVIAIPG